MTEQLTHIYISSVQSLSRVQLFATPWTAARQASLSITNSRSPPKLVSIESVMPSSHLILCHSLLLPPSIFPSIRVFSNESAGQRIEVSASALAMNIQDWFPLGGLVGSPCCPMDSQKSSPTTSPKFKSINSSALRSLYSPTLTSIHDYWKNNSLTRQTFVGKVVSLLFNMLSRLLMTFLPRTKWI